MTWEWERKGYEAHDLCSLQAAPLLEESAATLFLGNGLGKIVSSINRIKYQRGWSEAQKGVFLKYSLPCVWDSKFGSFKLGTNR